MTEHRFPTASLRTHWRDGLLVVESSGVLTESVIAAMQAVVAPLARGAWSIVADHTRSVLCFDTWAAATLGRRFAADDGLALQPPVALVLPAHLEFAFDPYRRVMADAGLERHVVASSAQALEWAARRATLRAVRR